MEYDAESKNLGGNYPPSNTEKNSYSVTAFSKKFAKVVKEIGFNIGISDPLNKVVFHTLRHTFCSWLAIKGVPIYTIVELAGHKTMAITQRYAKLSPDSKHHAINEISAMLDKLQTNNPLEILSE